MFLPYGQPYGNRKLGTSLFDDKIPKLRAYSPLPRHAKKATSGPMPEPESKTRSGIVLRIISPSGLTSCAN